VALEGLAASDTETAVYSRPAEEYHTDLVGVTDDGASMVPHKMCESAGDV
jgi:hypothetical protein